MSVSPYMGSLHIWAVFVECMGDVTMSQWEHSFVECIQVISIYGQYLLVMSVSPYMGSLHIWAVFVECIGDVSIGDVTMSQWEHSFVECIQVISIYGHWWCHDESVRAFICWMYESASHMFDVRQTYDIRHTPQFLLFNCICRFNIYASLICTSYLPQQLEHQ